MANLSVGFVDDLRSFEMSGLRWFVLMRRTAFYFGDGDVPNGRIGD